MKKTILGALVCAVMAVTSHAAAPPALAVKDVDHAARQPWSYVGNVHMDYPDFASATNDYVVPAGKRLVVEQVSVRVLAPSGQQFHGLASSTQSGYHYFDLTYKGMYYADGLSIGNTLLKMYIAPGDHFWVTLYRAGNDAACNALVFASGYLVDLP